MMEDREKLAVIGCGVAGLTCAYLLQNKYDVTIFEKNDYLGGHTNTIKISEGRDAGVAVDSGFIVCNDQTYPLFHKLIEKLGVKVRSSTMSFSYYDRTEGFYYSGSDLNGLFAQRKNVLKPSFWKMLFEIKRFCSEGLTYLEKNDIQYKTIGEYVKEGKYSDNFSERYLYPMMASIWSSPMLEAKDFPARALLGFFRNHGLLSLKNRPKWQTVVGGSSSYVEAFRKKFNGKIHLSSEVSCIKRNAGKVFIKVNNSELQFDKAVIASHADEAFNMLSDPSPDEISLLGAWKYQENKVLLHTDTGVLTPSQRAWSSWNYIREKSDDSTNPVNVTYYMNALQGLRTHDHYMVSLNLSRKIERNAIMQDLEYMHPIYNFNSMNTQSNLQKLNLVGSTYYCGSYFGYGFHEDAVRSAVCVCNLLGADL